MGVLMELGGGQADMMYGTALSLTTEDQTSRAPPPKKKWIKNYLEEDYHVPVSNNILHRNGVVHLVPQHQLLQQQQNQNQNSTPTITVPITPTAPIPIPPLTQHHHALLVDHVDLPRTRSNSNGSSGPRSGTREVHNKLEKNRRAHLKECFELLKRQLPASADDKKSSNLSILDSAIRYIQVLRRRERECEHEMERLAREKIAAQQTLAALRRDSPSLSIPRLHHPSNHDRETDLEEENICTRLSPMQTEPIQSKKSVIYCTSTDSEMRPINNSPPHPRLSPTIIPTAASLDLTTKPPRNIIANTPGTQTHGGGAIYSRVSQSPPSVHRSPPTQSVNSFTHHALQNGVVATPGTLNLTVSPSLKSINRNQKHSQPTLTVTAISTGQGLPINQGVITTQSFNPEKKLVASMSTPINGQTTLVPTQLHLPISQVMNGSGIVMGPSIQLFSATPQTLRVIQGQGGALAPIDIPTTAANSPIQRVREISKSAEVGVTSSDISRAPQHHIAIKPQPGDSHGGIAHMMNGLTPLVVSQGGTHIITASPHLTGKVMSGPLLKANVNQQIPLTVNTQYIGNIGTTAIVKPVVVVSTSNNRSSPPSTTQ